METLTIINQIIAVAFFICYAHQFFYMAVPFIKKNKPHKNTKLHKYAVLIAARNEEAVIGQLIESIKKQNYPSELITTFVVADNCTDATAEVARRAGATVWERSDTEKKGKGYALKFLMDRIHEKYIYKTFDGYFVFDADNLLDENFVSEMNKTFSDGYRIITSYRNSKNYESNWISAGYALWFMRDSHLLNHARMLLGKGCAVSGTGFLFHYEIAEKMDGWNCFLLTEDTEFTIASVLDDEKIGYCSKAVIYDEQPTRFGQSWSQRLRWAKGGLQVFKKYGGRITAKMFLDDSFTCYDMIMQFLPAIFLTVASLGVNFAATIVGIAVGADIITVLTPFFNTIFGTYMTFLFIGLFTTISEYKNIHCSTVKKVMYIFTFPLFMLTYIPIAVTAIFKRVEWKQIKHCESKTIDEIGAEKIRSRRKKQPTQTY